MNNRGFVFVFLLVLLGLIVAILMTPTQDNWTFTYSRFDKNPHGSYVIYEELDQIFPKADFTTGDTSIHYLIKDWRQDSSALIIITDGEDLSSYLDYEPLDSFVYAGNQVFLAAESIYFYRNDSNKYSFNAEVESDWLFPNSYMTLNKERDEKYWAKLLNQYQEEFFEVRFEYLHYYLRSDSTSHFKLGYVNDSLNFIRIPNGEGNYFLFSNPGIFTNNAMLHDSLSNYASDVLSYLGQDVRHIIWDETTKPGYWFLKQMSQRQQSPLSFIKNNRALNIAYTLTIITCLLLIFVMGKRLQQVIPVIKPPENLSLDFAKTLGRFYYEKHQNIDIAKKRIHYFENDFKNHYGFPIDSYRQDVNKLSQIMDTPESTIKAYFTNRDFVNQVQELTDERLMNVSNTIEQMKI